jgi:glucose/arabinose dehydrogenase
VLNVARYYAYGVRNSFGMALDPVTAALWMTENGPTQYDEINRVVPGMNSGWTKIMGPDSRDPQGVGDLYDIPGAGSTYDDPEFSWLAPIGVTAMVFPYASNLGPAYNQSVLVADANFGALYAFPLNAARTALNVASYSGTADLVADSVAEREQFRIGSGFRVPTDLQLGPDGNLYVLSYYPGTLYRISGPGPAIPVPGLSPLTGALLALLIAGASGLLLARRSSQPG